ncbi:septum formation inhibitor MinC [Bradyrhizobium sp. F1.13.1]
MATWLEEIDTARVLGTVATGAEIVAGRSIDVYGALRGRATAGSSGNATARIFCQKIQAERLAMPATTKLRKK